MSKMLNVYIKWRCQEKMASGLENEREKETDRKHGSSVLYNMKKETTEIKIKNLNEKRINS
jgi:hypothetical protein